MLNLSCVVSYTERPPVHVSWLHNGIEVSFRGPRNGVSVSLTHNRSVFDLETIPILHPHYHTHSGNTSRLVKLAVVHWLVSYEDENEYGNDNGNVIED